MMTTRWSKQQVKAFASDAKSRFGAMWNHVSDEVRVAIVDAVCLNVLTQCIDSTFTSQDISDLKQAVRKAAGLLPTQY